MLNIEIRGDGAQICGYVNATEKKSRPVITPRGRVIEEIEPRAFQAAIDRAENVTMTKDHEQAPILAETRAGTLKLWEDDIGLYADAVVSDPETVAEARAGKIKGWSFGMRNVVDSVEERPEGLPLRKVTALDLDHITLVVRKNPIYSATSVEVRAEGEVETEIRSAEDTVQIREEEKPDPLAEFRARAEALRNPR